MSTECLQPQGKNYQENGSCDEAEEKQHAHDDRERRAAIDHSALHAGHDERVILFRLITSQSVVL